MRMGPDTARQHFARAAVGVLATADLAGRPHLVPVVFVVEGNAILSAVDRKPKQTTALRRLANIEKNPQVAMLLHHYEDDWDHLWWARADGAAGTLDPHSPRSKQAIKALVAKYCQYSNAPPVGPVVAIEVQRWSGWQASGASGGVRFSTP